MINPSACLTCCEFQKAIRQEIKTKANQRLQSDTVALVNLPSQMNEAKCFYKCPCTDGQQSQPQPHPSSAATSFKVSIKG
ncbi:hypothetical protein FOXYSP1_05102 [Fusarium oxysporum f. sp. phaseoli]